MGLWRGVFYFIKLVLDSIKLVLDSIKTAVELLATAVNPNGGIDVNIQDQTTRPLQLFFTKAIGAPTTLSANVVIESRTISLTDATNFNIGNYVGIFSGASGERRFYFGEVLAKAGNDITLDSPIDFAFIAGDNVISTIRELGDVDGSVTPQVFSIGPFGEGGGAGGFEIDLTRILIKMITDNAPSFPSFGDIAGGLDIGLVLRRNNSEIDNIFNIKTNGELTNLCYDLTFYSSLNPSGVNGIGARMTFGGQSKHGVVIRLAAGESLELVIQDDLTDLLSFRVVAQGHIVD